ncbi:hypothetical protein HAHE_30780 [Haloferula helveola]|uniref:Uncharacterized protein n=1 Tax=Haloferula helveola TaxID=490095 RepID=A0ABM7RBY5_9BACT|nr:hypothetical protein HAHE_30780 [Haloferula helveola]
MNPLNSLSTCNRGFAKRNPISTGAAGTVALAATGLGVMALRRPDPEEQPQHNYDNQYHKVVETTDGRRPYERNPLRRYPLSCGVVAMAAGFVAAMLVKAD